MPPNYPSTSPDQYERAFNFGGDVYYGSINVRQEHRPLPGTPRRAGRSIADCRGAWTGQEGTRSVAARLALSRCSPGGDDHFRAFRQWKLALQHHDAVVDATTDFHPRILSRLVIGIKSTPARSQAVILIWPRPITVPLPMWIHAAAARRGERGPGPTGRASEPATPRSSTSAFCDPE